MSWTGNEKPQEDAAETRDATEFDVVHHRNPRTGKVYRTDHYAYIVKKDGISYYIRHGKKYHADGTPFDKASEEPEKVDPKPEAQPELPSPEKQPEPEPQPEPEQPAAAVDEMEPKSKRAKKPKIDENPLKNVSAR